jgi:hypothetical protein
MDAEQRTKILDKVIDLMDEIQQDEKDLHQVSQNKRMKSDIVDSFLTTATTSTNGKASGQVTPRPLIYVNLFLCLRCPMPQFL